MWPPTEAPMSAAVVELYKVWRRRRCVSERVGAGVAQGFGPVPGSLQHSWYAAAFADDRRSPLGVVGDGVHRVEQFRAHVVAAWPVVVTQRAELLLDLMNTVCGIERGEALVGGDDQGVPAGRRR